MRRFLRALACISILCPAGLYAAQTSDPRFFGTYCQQESEKFCETVIGFLGFTIIEECVTVANAKAHVDYTESHQGGLVVGDGTLTLDGDPTSLVMAGVVLSRGVIRGSATVLGAGRYVSRGDLSSDGLALTISARGESLTVRKDACGNNPPSVSISSPGDGASLVFGSSATPFRGDIQDEDASFPLARMVFTSDRDSVLTGSKIKFSKGLTLFPNRLSPGNHVITFSATDSGGLTASASINITVTNQKPDRPVIVQPLTDDTIVATGDVILEGKAFDLEDGLLQANSLVWRAKLGIGPFNFLGTGQRFVTSFNSPGPVTIRLTAIDSLGTESDPEDRNIVVQPFAGNTPPRVTIEIPDHLKSAGTVAAALNAGDVTFVGTVEDTEDPTTDLALIWEAEAINPAGEPSKTFGANSTVATVSLTPGQNTIYRITFSATDSGGLVGKKIIKLLILSSPIL